MHIYIYENWKCEPLSHVWLFVTPWTVACQAPQSMEFSRQEYWSGNFSRVSSQPRNWTWVSCIAGGSFIFWATKESCAYIYIYMCEYICMYILIPPYSTPRRQTVLSPFYRWRNKLSDFPGGPVAKDSAIPMQGVWVPSPVVRELEPTCCAIKSLPATTKSWRSQINKEIKIDI